jgi:signal recognition particle subunit SEC65
MGQLIQGAQTALARRQTDRSNKMEDGTKELAYSAYMGNQDSIKDLMAVNPEYAMKLLDRREKQQYEQQQYQAKQQAHNADMNQKLKTDMEGIMANISKFPDAESARPYAEAQFQEIMKRHPEAMRGVNPEDLIYDEGDYNQAKVLFGQGKEKSKMSQVSFKDATGESIAKYEQSGDANDLVRYKPEIRKIAGIDHQINPATDKWEPIVDLTNPAITEQAKALAKIEADKQSEKDFAKSKMKWEDSETQIINAIDSADSKTKLLDNTTDKLKKLLNDRMTKYGTSILSKFPATDERTIEGLVTTIEANSTFTTLTDLKASGGTLGAIAQKELELLSSALGKIDRYGKADEMIRVLDQISQANTDSVRRLRDGYARDKERYSKGFQSDAQAETVKPQTIIEVDF